MVEKLLIHRDFKRPRNRTQDTNKVMGVGGDPPHLPQSLCFPRARKKAVLWLRGC